MFRNILIAIDGSPLADRALDTGLALAQALKASVTLVTVSEGLSALEITALVRINADEAAEQYEALAEKVAREVLMNAKDKAAPVPAQAVLVKNRPAAVGIVETATVQSCDLIVMASHGRRGLRKMILGSVTNEVLAMSKIPVLVTR